MTNVNHDKQIESKEFDVKEIDQHVGYTPSTSGYQKTDYKRLHNELMKMAEMKEFQRELKTEFDMHKSTTTPHTKSIYSRVRQFTNKR